MTAATVKRGFEGKVYIGTAGSTASTQLIERTDITYNLTSETADSTAAGDGESPPLKTEELVAIAVSDLGWQMLYKTEDTNVATMIDAVVSGDPIAVKFIRHATDSDAFDGDVFIDFGTSLPLSDNQKLDIKCKITRRLRAPVFG